MAPISSDGTHKESGAARVLGSGMSGALYLLRQVVKIHIDLTIQELQSSSYFTPSIQ